VSAAPKFTTAKRTERRRALVWGNDERRMRRYFYIGIAELRAAGTPMPLRSFRQAMRACRKVARDRRAALAKVSA
jgi:hypothetical protein